MSAYLVAFADVKDQEQFVSGYVEKAYPIVLRHGGKALCIAPTNAKEGNFPPGEIVIIEFPDMDHAEAFYNDPEYQPLIQFRQTISDTHLGLFPGLE